jgi:hypothetical protein
VERTQIYPTLVTALINWGYDRITIERYGQLWDSITSANRLPCPLCFAHDRLRSALKALPERDGKESMRCEVCVTVFYLPLSA